MNALRPITLNGGLEEVIVTFEAPSKMREIAIQSFKLYFPLNLLTPHIDRRALVVYKPFDFKKIALRLIEITKIKDELRDIREMYAFSYRIGPLLLRMQDVSSQFISLGKHEVSLEESMFIWFEIIDLSCELRDSPKHREFQRFVWEGSGYEVLARKWVL